MSERDPIDVAREAWALEWKETSWGTIWAWCGPVHIYILQYPNRWVVKIESNGDRRNIDHEDLREVLRTARRLTLERLEAAAALCRDPAKEERDRWLGVHAPEVHRPPGHVDALGDDETVTPTIEDYRRRLAAMHRRAQKAEGALERCEVIPKGSPARYERGDYYRVCRELGRLPLECGIPCVAGNAVKAWPLVKKLVDATGAPPAKPWPWAESVPASTPQPPPTPGGSDARLWSELRLLVERAEALVANVEDYRARPDDRSPPSLALTRRLRKRLDHARATLDSTKGTTPVPVYVHENGEAVLMLTLDDGSVYPVVSTWVLDVEAVGDRSEVLLGGTDETWLNARESAEDIRATLQILAKESTP